MPIYNPAFALYLTFNGNCHQAFNYYKSCFGGELRVQTLADTPHITGMTKTMRTMVICAILKNQYFKLVGTDLAGEDRIVSGNNLSILVECKSVAERSKLIGKLTGGNTCADVNNNSLVDVTDMFSIRWILSV